MAATSCGCLSRLARDMMRSVRRQASDRPEHRTERHGDKTCPGDRRYVISRSCHGNPGRTGWGSMTVSSSRHYRRVAPGLISHALEVAGRLANDATDVITATAGRGAKPTAKESPFDWVTDTDRTLERHTRRVLTAEFPGIPV